MIRLITQYNHISAQGTPFPRNGLGGWDGAHRTDLFHIIDINGNGSSIARSVGRHGHTDMTPSDWLDTTEHLNNFRLEFMYE